MSGSIVLGVAVSVSLRLTVPDEHEKVLRHVAGMDTLDLDRLLAAVGGGARSESDLETSLAEAGFGESKALAAALLSATATRIHFQASVEDMAKALADALDPPVPSENFLTILRYPDLLSAAKAADLEGSFKNELHTARIVSDLRPVFDEDSSEPNLIGALVVNTLELTYVSDGRVSSLFVSLDAQDLKGLRRQVERAEAKLAVLDLQLEKSGIKRLNGSGR